MKSKTSATNTNPATPDGVTVAGVRVAAVIPGVAAALAIAIAGVFAARFLGQAILQLQGLDAPGKASPISAITVAILLGLLIRNLFGSSPVLEPGLKFSLKRLLRIGIVLVGLKLSLFDVLQLGGYGVPFVAGLIVIALVSSWFLGTLFGVSPTLATLTAAATAICGVTATLATAPVIGADDEEVAYTVANVTLLGLFGMLVYPYLAHLVFDGVPAAAGLFLGTTIHDTSQVMGAALSYRQMYSDEVAFKVATITKLTRNVFIALVVPLLGYLYSRRLRDTVERPARFAQLFPLFVVAFVAMTLVRSLGDAGLAGESHRALGLFDAATWNRLITFFGETASVWLLATAMAAVGLSTDVSIFRRLGARPFYLAASVAAIVAITSLLLAGAFGAQITV